MEGFTSPFRLLLWFILSQLVLLQVRAHSVLPEPLTYLEFVTTPSMLILPRDNPKHFQQSPIISRDIEADSSLRHDDSLRIQFTAFNRTFSIHLEPNLDLFHPEATITIHYSNSRETTRLRPEDHRLYKGVLLDIDSTEKRLSEDIVGLKRMSLSGELSHSSGVLGWARIQIHDDGGVTQYRKNHRYPTFEGTFSLNNELYHIKSIENFKLTQFKDDPEIPNPSARHQIHQSATMVIYRDSDIKNSPQDKKNLVGSCAMDDIISVKNRNDHLLGYNNDQHIGQFRPWWDSLHIGEHKLSKRDTTGCPTAKKIAYMGAAADCTYVAFYSSPDAARKQILQDWSSASAVYEKTFNVVLGLVNITVLNQNCPQTVDPALRFNRPCSDSYTINDRLNDFSDWRGTFPDDGVSLWHLMSQCNTGTQVGIAWLDQLCTTKSTKQDQSIVSGTGVSTIVKDEWKVVAHEVGHGFGAVHDCVTGNCPCNGCGCCPLSDTTCDANNQFIMNPTSNVATDQFSPCSINSICTAIPKRNCLEDPGTRTILSQGICGNGLKEGNEQCDCGSPADCANDPCCNPNCTFKANAVCDDKNDMCCKSCQFKPANEVCRPAGSNCDIPESCSGTSGDCPPDNHIQDGTSCGSGLECANGQCTSRDKQCQSRGSLMGISKACPMLTDSSCTLSCANPNDTSTCIQMNGFFMDGTPCGFGGRCNGGQCKSASLTDSVTNWFNQNKGIAIPIVVIVGLLLLCCIIQCAYRCSKRRTQRTKLRVPSLPPDDRYSRPNNYNYNNYNSNYNNNYNAHNGGNRWVDPSPYNGRLAPSYNNERSIAPMPMPTPTHLQQRSRHPDYEYAGTGSMQPVLQPQASSRSMNLIRSPSSPNTYYSSSRNHFVDETPYNGPRTNRS